MIGIHEVLLSLVVTTLALGALLALEKRTFSVRADLEHADELRSAILLDPHSAPSNSWCTRRSAQLLECVNSEFHTEIKILFLIKENS